MDHRAQATTDHDMQHVIKSTRRAGSTNGNYTATAKMKPPPEWTRTPSSCLAAASNSRATRAMSSFISSQAAACRAGSIS